MTKRHSTYGRISNLNFGVGDTTSGGTPSGGTPSGGTPSGGTPSGGTPSGVTGTAALPPGGSFTASTVATVSWSFQSAEVIKFTITLK